MAWLRWFGARSKPLTSHDVGHRRLLLKRSRMLMGPANVVVPIMLAAVGLAAVSLPTVHSLMSMAANGGNGGDLDMPPDERLSHWLHGC
jgi:hypothetical protein